MRQAYPERRLIAVFEPRTNTSRRKDFQAAYMEAFEAAQVVFLSTPPFRHNDDPANFLGVSELVASISAGGAPAFAFDGADALLPHLLDHVRPGDVIVIMSNGGFGGLHDRLLQHLNRENALRQ
jgi:UDP-N-acetylmuramate: L-alanyl-gamma-D-glutamyl-meso-diaminopimelate ligase